MFEKYKFWFQVKEYFDTANYYEDIMFTGEILSKNKIE